MPAAQRLGSFSNPPPLVPNTLVSFPSAHVLLVTLNRPDHLNAIPSTQHAAFDALWRWFDAEPSLRCAVITGEGRAFSAGADLKEWNARIGTEAAGSSAGLAHTSGFGGLSNRTGKKPVIAAVNGHCFGGGMEMALNCDMILASPSALFGLPEVRIGVVALAGALPRLIRCVGRQRAAEMALLGRRYSAKDLQVWGLVNAVVPEGQDVVEEAVRWAEEVAGNSPDAVIVSKDGLRLGWEGIGPLEATDTLIHGLFQQLERGENMREGISSFVEGRKPAWRDSKL